MKLMYAKNPKWANRSKTLINLTVRFEEIEEDLPFTASLSDPEAHGKEIYQNAINEEYGAISEFQATKPSINVIINQIKIKRNSLLTQTDWTQLPDVPEATRQTWENYRQELRNIPQLVDFPWYDDVVVESDMGYEIDWTKIPFPISP
jgi:hypothetical protein